MSADRMELNALSGLNLTLISTEVQSAISEKEKKCKNYWDWLVHDGPAWPPIVIDEFR